MKARIVCILTYEVSFEIRIGKIGEIDIPNNISEYFSLMNHSWISYEI